MSGKESKKHFGTAIINKVKEMVLLGKTQAQVSEYFALEDKSAIKQLLKRDCAKERHIAANLFPTLVY